jgi:leader peptidase (prepilin peptidase)/N-methyltransferase
MPALDFERARQPNHAGLELSPELRIAVWALFGLVIGSFLNVCIHRLPLEGETVTRPRRSRCPACRRELTAWENIPVVSWLALRGRCRTCGWRIPLRYPLVELLNGVLWGLAGYLAPSIPIGIVQAVALSGLVVSSAVDFERFEIPDQISIGGMVLAPIVSFLLPELHDTTWVARELSGGGAVDRLGALLGSVSGLAVGGGSLLLIGALGKRAFGREAMGLGDVKLLAAGGGLVGPGGALMALFLGSVVASLVGAVNLVRFYCLSRSRVRARGTRKPRRRSLASARIAGRYLPFGPYLGLGIGIVLLDWQGVHRLVQELVFP